jgi:hypothetical protein
MLQLVTILSRNDVVRTVVGTLLYTTGGGDVTTRMLYARMGNIAATAISVKNVATKALSVRDPTARRLHVEFCS